MELGVHRGQGYPRRNRTEEFGEKVEEVLLFLCSEFELPAFSRTKTHEIASKMPNEEDIAPKNEEIYPKAEVQWQSY